MKRVPESYVLNTVCPLKVYNIRYKLFLYVYTHLLVSLPYTNRLMHGHGLFKIISLLGVNNFKII
jgi:hypothetical protein